MVPVEILPPAEEGLARLTRGKKSQVLDKLDEVEDDPFIGDHKQRELYCCYSLRISHIRVVYTLREGKAIVLAIGPHDWAYSTAADVLGSYFS